jgi:hypothetical protein
MSRLKATDIMGEIRHIAAERPEYVYIAQSDLSTCQYFEDDGSPGCIVGHALDRFGFNEVEEEVPASECLADLGINGEWSEYEWLDTVQHAQDQMVPWGEAVQVADGKISLESALVHVASKAGSDENV